jgi:VanZ family protein
MSVAAFCASFVRAWIALPDVVRGVVCILYMTAIVVLSLLPSAILDKVPVHVIFMDKVVHALMYAGCTGLLFCGLSAPQRTTRSLIVVFFCCFCFGVILEVLQGTLTALHRTFSLDDIAANTVGALACAWFLRRNILRLAVPAPNLERLCQPQ